MSVEEIILGPGTEDSEEEIPELMILVALSIILACCVAVLCAKLREVVCVLRRLETEMELELGRFAVAEEDEDRLDAHRRLAALIRRSRHLAESSGLGLLAAERENRRSLSSAHWERRRSELSQPPQEDRSAADTLRSITGTPISSQSQAGRVALLEELAHGPRSGVLREEAFAFVRPASPDAAAAQRIPVGGRAVDPVAVAASRQRILEQVRRSRASVGSSSASSPSPGSQLPSPRSTSSEETQATLGVRSILKKRQPLAQTPSPTEPRHVRLRSPTEEEEDDMDRKSPFTNQQRATFIADLAPALTKPPAQLTTQVYRRTTTQGGVEEHVETQSRFSPSVSPRPDEQQFSSSITLTSSAQTSPPRHDITDYEPPRHYDPPPPQAQPPPPPQQRYEPPHPISEYRQPPQAKMTNGQTTRGREIQEPTPNPAMSRTHVQVSDNGVETLEIDELTASREWDPIPLLNHLYQVDYSGRPETKKNRFINMEGHLEHLPIGLRGALTESQWVSHYFKTKDGRLLWFKQAYADEYPFGEMQLSGADVDMSRDDCSLRIRGGRENVHLVLRCPSALLEKWRNAVASHAASDINDYYVRPTRNPEPHPQKAVIIELGSTSIRAGFLTESPSLPQLYFPSLAAALPDKEVVVGVNALWAATRHVGSLICPIRQPSAARNRYEMDLDVLNHFFIKIFHDLEILNPHEYKVVLSVPEDSPGVLVGQLAELLLDRAKGVGVGSLGVARHPSLVLYAYDVTTGVVVDIGHRLNIVPIIDGYVVQSAIVSLPLGSNEIADALRLKLSDTNTGVYSFQNTAENFILRYIMEEACYVATDFEEESAQYDKDPKSHTRRVSLQEFKPSPQMMKEFLVDSAAFTAPEGLFEPKEWGMDLKGLHKLIASAIQASPMDSRRTLYRNIYMAGGCSLLPGLAERVENELAKLVAPTIHIQVRVSPWRLHAAYIGAQVLGASRHFNANLVNLDSLPAFVHQLKAQA